MILRAQVLWANKCISDRNLAVHNANGRTRSFGGTRSRRRHENTSEDATRPNGFAPLSANGFDFGNFWRSNVNRSSVLLVLKRVRRPMQPTRLKEINSTEQHAPHLPGYQFSLKLINYLLSSNYLLLSTMKRPATAAYSSYGRFDVKDFLLVR